MENFFAEKINTLNSLKRLQGENGNWNCSPYMLGMYNGIEVVLSILEEREPQFKSRPEDGFLDEKIKKFKPELSSCDCSEQSTVDRSK